jgi:hypothetical protein
MEKRRTFRTERELFHADTCEPLKRAVASGGLSLEAISRGGYPGNRLPGNELKELCMAGYWNAPGQQDWGLDWHCNEGIEIGYVSAGRLPFSVGSKSMTVGPGELTITRPWQRHRVGDPNVPACHYSWIILDVRMRRPNQLWQWPKWLLFPKSGLDRLTETLRQNEDPVWHGDRRIGDCFSRLDEIVARGVGETNLTRFKIVINELVVLLAELLESSNPHLDASLSQQRADGTLVSGKSRPSRRRTMDAGFDGGCLRSRAHALFHALPEDYQSHTSHLSRPIAFGKRGRVVVI